MVPMSLAITSLEDFGRWARGDALEIVLLVSGAILLARLVRWLGHRITTRIDARDRSGDVLVASEAAKHRHAAAQVITWTSLVLIYVITGLLVLQRFGIPLASLVGPATVVGVAVGIGAQHIVHDLLAGLCIVTERQYGFGDVIRLSTLGATTGVSGTVEDVTLRVTRLRTLNGEVVIVPNGQIQQVTNLSRDWARTVIDVPVPVAVDIQVVSDMLIHVGEEAFRDEELRPLMLDQPSVMGVESIEVDQFKVRVVARTLPGKQFEVGRELRARIAGAFRQGGITVPAGLETAGPPRAS
jgi:small-conductance mechanosensitive channel